MGYYDYNGKVGYVYILSNYNRNIFYIGVTSNLEGRIRDHKNNEGSKFTKKYNLKFLVYYEEFPNIVDAILREKQLKNWHHEWKVNLIKKLNPSMKDLALNILL
ncbi:GIY-YIG nuclease family protein [Balneolaceae bacterium YR4-1]|uniref:GIY-YIG nuclease family protein n=1 Tax=Halalkalibaculum roseum TaxID=2709311 RepID=A0A6M1T4S9_9BACT|nr:GIY-YIG nuclease family protein [Halalkalibaculum roseum]NGP76995.1 GIY-YIG nuclease family protein [Halalkalibaculum roseum]